MPVQELAPEPAPHAAEPLPEPVVEAALAPLPEPVVIEWAPEPHVEVPGPALVELSPPESPPEPVPAPALPPAVVEAAHEAAGDATLLAPLADAEPVVDAVDLPPPPEPAAPPPPAPPPAERTGIPLPLGDAVHPAWLAEREAALQGLRADFTTAMAAARQSPPADLSATTGTAWLPATADHDGHPPPGAVWVADAAAAAERAALIAHNWRINAGIESAPPEAGQWLAFDESAFADIYRRRAAEQARAGQAPAALAALGRLYELPAADVLATHAELWALATEAHAPNAGPPPRPGMAMGDVALLGQLDLYLADPFITELRTQLGGTPEAPASGLAREQQRLHGAERYAELTRLDQALAAVRQAHADAMRAARDGGGIGWVDVPMQTGTDPETGWPTGYYETVGEGDIVRDAEGRPVLATTRVFDPARFTNAWLDDGLARGDLARARLRAVLRPGAQRDRARGGKPHRQSGPAAVGERGPAGQPGAGPKRMVRHLRRRTDRARPQPRPAPERRPRHRLRSAAGLGHGAGEPA